MFASLHLQVEWSGRVLWVEESGVEPLDPQAHTHAPSHEEELSTELQELQAYGDVSSQQVQQHEKA